MKWYTRSCDRPRKRSASAALPSSVSNRYSLSTRTHGSSRRRRASSSLRRVSSFSALSSSSRAASHSSRVPVLGVVIGRTSLITGCRGHPCRGCGARSPASDSFIFLAPRLFQILVREFPVDDVPPCLDVLRARVAIVDVVRVLPHVAGKDRGLAVADRAARVMRSDHLE